MTQLLDTMVSALASILGILIAVTLVAFELSREGYRTYALRLVFGEPKVAELVALYLGTIVLSSTLLASIKSPLPPYQVGITYVCLILFAISLIVLVPYCKQIMTRTHDREDIKRMVTQIVE